MPVGERRGHVRIADRTPRGVLIGATAGLLWGAAFSAVAAPPLSRWLAGLVALGGLFYAWDVAARRGRPREAASGGFAFGLCAFALGCHWIHHGLHVTAGRPAWLSVSLLLLLAAIMGFWLALGGFWAAHAAERSRLAPVLVFPAVWTLIEWLRGWAFTGVPWLSAGYLAGPAVAGSWLAHLAAWGGAGLLGLFTASLAGTALAVLRSRTGVLRRGLVVALCVGAAGALAQIPYGEPWKSGTADWLRVRLVQGGVPQERKWGDDFRDALQRYRQLSFEPHRSGNPGDEPPDLIVWPELAIPSTRAGAREFVGEMDRLAGRQGSALALGILSENGDGDLLNSLVVVGAGEGVYSKRRLVPFSERFAEGPAAQAPIRVGRALCGVSICYEAAFGREQRDWLPEAHLLVNVSNDGWFDTTPVLDQHLDMVRVRAMESGRFLVRAANTGITAVATPSGVVRQQLPKHAPGFLDARLPLLRGETPYVRHGDWPVLLLCVACATLGIALPAMPRFGTAPSAGGQAE